MKWAKLWLFEAMASLFFCRITFLKKTYDVDIILLNTCLGECGQMGKKDALTVAEIVVKAATSPIPVGGSLVASVIDEVKSRTMQKRQDEWMNMIEERLGTLEIDFNSIGDNEYFTTAIIKATELAVKTAENEKREYLANAVINAITFTAEESVLMIYMEMLEKYTVWHLQVLSHFYNPEHGIGRGNESMGAADSPLYRRYPHMVQRKDVVDKIVIDLQNEGMLTSGSYWHSSMTSNGIYAKRTTALGDGFLKFIMREE